MPPPPLWILIDAKPKSFWHHFPEKLRNSVPVKNIAGIFEIFENKKIGWFQNG